MNIGFTGTSHGMTPLQRYGVWCLFESLPVTVFHHGDCIGADAEAHKLAERFNARIIVHPPTCADKRAWLLPTWPDDHRPPYSYLIRNQQIVKESRDGLIAAPRQPTEVLRSGTWATVRYARKAGRQIWVVLPDGKIRSSASTPDLR